MASDVSFVQFVVDQIGDAGEITYRKMFGEYALYCDGKIMALVCDNQLFIKPTEAGRSFIGNPTEAPPYPGAKLYFLVEGQLEDRDWMSDLVRVTVEALPEPRPRPGKRKKRRG